MIYVTGTFTENNRTLVFRKFSKRLNQTVAFRISKDDGSDYVKVELGHTETDVGHIKDEIFVPDRATESRETFGAVMENIRFQLDGV